MSQDTNLRQGADMSQMDEKRRIVDAVRAAHLRTTEDICRAREDGRLRLEPLQQACADSGGHLFTVPPGSLGGPQCLFCGAPKPRVLPEGVSAEKAAAVGLLLDRMRPE